MHTFHEKENKIKALFEGIKDKQKIYLQIIEFGKSLPPLPKDHQIEENRVPGCQSTSYLYSTIEDGRMHFTGTSDALISKGLLALMITLYNDATPETLLTLEPTCLKELNILSSISITRLNGLSGLYTMMRQKALKATLKRSRN